MAVVLHKLISLSKEDKLHHGLLFTGSNQSEIKDIALKFAEHELSSGIDNNIVDVNDINASHNSNSLSKSNLQYNSKSNFNSNSNFNFNFNSKSNSLFLAGTHPDFFQVDLELGSNFIKIEQIRSLNSFVEIRPQMSNKKVAIINSAEKLSAEAANALLKTLEEPVSNTTIILIAGIKQGLLETISSRCMEINLEIANKFAPLQYIAKESCSIGDRDSAINLEKNKECDESKECDENKINKTKIFSKLIFDLHNLLINKNTNVVIVAENWCKLCTTNILIDILYEVISSIIKNKNDMYLKANARNLDDCNYLVNLHNCIPKTVAFNILDSIINYKKNVKFGQNPNIQLFIEQILLNLKTN